MIKLSVVMLVISLFAAAGCTSITSRLLERNAMNSKWDRPTHLNGIPITLKVPTHVKLYVFDVHFLQAIPLKNDAARAKVAPLDLDVPIRDFSSEFLYTEKIFTVDFKRPAGGSANLRLDMSEDQYIAKMQHDITDKTIENVNDVLTNLLPDGGLFKLKPAGGNQAGSKGLILNSAPNISPIKSLVAVGVFEVDAPDFEIRVTEFLNCHINKAHDAWVTPPNGTGQRPRVKRVQPMPEFGPPPLCVDGACVPETNGPFLVNPN